MSRGNGKDGRRRGGLERRRGKFRMKAEFEFARSFKQFKCHAIEFGVDALDANRDWIIIASNFQPYFMASLFATIVGSNNVYAVGSVSQVIQRLIAIVRHRDTQRIELCNDYSKDVQRFSASRATKSNASRFQICIPMLFAHIVATRNVYVAPPDRFLPQAARSPQAHQPSVPPSLRTSQP